MADQHQLVLYHIPQSRSLAALWMLEELGRPYSIRKLNMAAGEQRSAEYRRINPAGKVPAVVDGDLVITERGAICIYLADRYAPGTLAPDFDSPLRAEYLKWMFYAAGVIEPLFAFRYLKAPVELQPSSVAWGDWDTMMEVLTQGLAGKEYLLGDRFTAADVMAGGMLVWGSAVGVLPDVNPISAYIERLTSRPGFKRTAVADGQR